MYEEMEGADLKMNGMLDDIVVRKGGKYSVDVWEAL